MMQLPIKIGTTIPPSYILASPVKGPLWLGQKPPAKSGLVKLLLVPSTNLQRMYPITTPAKGAIHEIMLLLFFGLVEVSLFTAAVGFVSAITQMVFDFLKK